MLTKQFCKTCKKQIEFNSGFVRYYCSKDCFEKSRTRKCGSCGQLFISHKDRNILCDNCFNYDSLSHQDSHPLYKTYVAMIQRCYNPSRNVYDSYGGRGITVSEEWRKDFATFCQDLGPRPEGTTLDRIDNDLGYSKDNCRWVNIYEQRLNRRRFSNSSHKYKGVNKTASGTYTAALRYHGKSIYLGTFAIEEEAAEAYNRKLLELYGDSDFTRKYLNKVDYSDESN